MKLTKMKSMRKIKSMEISPVEKQDLNEDILSRLFEALVVFDDDLIIYLNNAKKKLDRDLSNAFGKISTHVVDHEFYSIGNDKN